MTTSRELTAFLNRHRRVLTLAGNYMRTNLRKGKRCSLGDVAWEVFRKTKWEVKEWRAKAVLSHAIRQGAFGFVLIRSGVGLTFREPKAPRTLSKAA